jgi:hypothetical protein
LIGLLVSSILLRDHPVYRIALVAQGLLYVWAALGLVFRDQLKGIRFALLGYYLVAIHFAYLVGLFRCLTGRAAATWQRVS